MSGHADTIHDYVTNTERYDGQWHRLPTDDETLAALDALLAENQRLREQWAQLVDAPNGIYTGTQLRKLAREALAGEDG